MENDFVKVAEASEIVTGQMKTVTLGDKEILIVNVDGSFYAIGQKCTHMGGDLSKGKLEGNIITCPRHHSQFDVRNGKVVKGPTILFMHPKIKDNKTYQLKVEQGNIRIKP
jgi:3-phenylpropionate/trans-cinnamate dioxygenase ferredoxin component